MKKVLAVLLAITLLLGVASFSFAEGEERPVITVLTTNSNEYENNVGIKLLQEITGVDLKFEYIGADTKVEKFNIMVQTDTLPDVIIEVLGYINNSGIYKLGVDGVFIPLNDLIDEYGPNTQAVWTEHPDYKDYVTTPDGNIYAMTGYYVGIGQEVRSHLYVDTKMLENVGLGVPTSIDELYDVLVAFRDQDANGNGKVDDEIPLMTWENDANGSALNCNIMGAFTQVSVTDNRLAKDGVVSFVPASDGYRDGLRFVRKLYDEGLLYSEVFSIDRNTIWTLAENDPNVNTIGMIPGHHANAVCNWDSKRWQDYAVVGALSGGNDVQSLPYDPNAGLQLKAAITSNCADPVAAMKVLDYTSGPEGMWLTYIGVEGNDWRQAPEGALDITGAPAAFQVIPTEERPENFIGGNLNHGWPAYQTDIVNGAAVDLSLTGFTAQAQMFTPKLYGDLYAPFLYPATDYWPVGIYFSEAALSELSIIETELNNAVKLAEAEFVMGVRDIETDWDAYIHQLKSIGLDRYLELSQAEYDANL